MTDYMDQGVPPRPDTAGIATGMLVCMGGAWEAVVTLAGQAQIRKPGWEITRQWSTMFQAIAISSRYRFAGQGSTPAEALADARRQMVLFRDELNQHLEAT